MNRLQAIVERRRERVAREGPALGTALPPRRQVPFVPFLARLHARSRPR